MYGLAEIIAMNRSVPKRVRRTPRAGLAPSPVVWGNRTVAIAWHRRDGSIKRMEVLDRQGWRMLRRYLSPKAASGDQK